MKQIFNNPVLLIFICVNTFISSIIGQNYRYVHTLFPASTITQNVVYGTAPFINSPYSNENNTTVKNLLMDIYQPQGDTNKSRPVIIFAHAGGFITGNKNHDDMMAFCDSFARKGYVTVTIDYRQGLNLIGNSDVHYTRAAYRGVQDGRTAVRFLRANAALYGIDPNKVYFAGSSAGAFIGLNSIFLDDPADKPSSAGVVTYYNLTFPFSYTTPDLGAYDIGANLNFKGEPDALLSMWGGIETPNVISTNDTQHVFLIHGVDDTSVPFTNGEPFGIPTFPEVYGSKPVHDKLNALNLISGNETYFVPGEGHEFYGTSNGTWDSNTGGNAYWDTIIIRSTDFFWKQHKPTANFTFSTTNSQTDFTDLSTGAVSWRWDFGDGSNISTQQHPTHNYANTGIYSVTLYIENTIESWDTISYSVTISQTATSLLEITKNNFARVFPNPTNNGLNIHLENTSKNVTVLIVDAFGKHVTEQKFQNQAKLKLDLSYLSDGIYLIQINADGLTQKTKIIKN